MNKKNVKIFEKAAKEAVVIDAQQNHILAAQILVIFHLQSRPHYCRRSGSCWNDGQYKNGLRNLGFDMALQLLSNLHT